MNTLRKLCQIINARIFRKDTREWVSPFTLRHIRRYEFAREHLVGRKVIDVGCGTGYGRDLLGDDIDYTGIDSDRRCIKCARAGYNGKYIHSSVFTVSFAPGSFDTAVAFEMLEHVKYPIKALRLMFKLLRKGGRLIVSIPMNHPDTIYHKKVYTYPKIQELFQHITAFSNISEHLQSHLTITPLLEKPDDSSRGTYIGIWEKQDKK